MDELEGVREKQARRIAGMRDRIDQTSQRADKDKGVTSQTIHALSSELRTTKMAVDELSKRERQVACGQRAPNPGMDVCTMTWKITISIRLASDQNSVVVIYNSE